MIFLLYDMEVWLKEQSAALLISISPRAGKLIKGSSYRLGLKGIAHILERHYHKTLRHPGTGKFTIPLTELLDLLKETSQSTPHSVNGTLQHRWVLVCDKVVGITNLGENSNTIVVITDRDGFIVTAFPE